MIIHDNTEVISINATDNTQTIIIRDGNENDTSVMTATDTWELVPLKEQNPVINADIYHGVYNVTPLPYAQQELQTAGKTLERNVVVKEIPYYEVSNPLGKTVYIGE